MPKWPFLTILAVKIAQVFIPCFYMQNKFIHSVMLFKLISNQYFLIKHAFSMQGQSDPPSMDLAPSEKPLRLSRINYTQIKRGVTRKLQIMLD